MADSKYSLLFPGRKKKSTLKQSDVLRKARSAPAGPSAVCMEIFVKCSYFSNFEFATLSVIYQMVIPCELVIAHASIQSSFY